MELDDVLEDLDPDLAFLGGSNFDILDREGFTWVISAVFTVIHHRVWGNISQVVADGWEGVTTYRPPKRLRLCM